MNVIRYSFKPHGCNQGKLVAIEELKDIPFPIRRVYYTYDLKPEDTRGHHAHKTLQQILICINGRCRLKLDNGKEVTTVMLDKPNEGIYIPNTVWREIDDFSPGAVLLILASELYDEADYIRDYSEFLRFVNGNGESDGQ